MLRADTGCCTLSFRSFLGHSPRQKVSQAPWGTLSLSLSLSCFALASLQDRKLVRPSGQTPTESDCPLTTTSTESLSQARLPMLRRKRLGRNRPAQTLGGRPDLMIWWPRRRASFFHFMQSHAHMHTVSLFFMQGGRSRRRLPRTDPARQVGCAAPGLYQGEWPRRAFNEPTRSASLCHYDTCCCLHMRHASQDAHPGLTSSEIL